MTTGALPIVVRPLKGESALSIISRLADANGIPLTRLHSKIGQTRRLDFGFNDDDWKRLTTWGLLSGSEIEEVRIRRVPGPGGNDLTNFMGHTIRVHYIVTQQVRLCPKCVYERRMLREVWRLQACVACIEHGTFLIDTCDCGLAIDETRRGAHAFQCRCGRDFSNLTTTPASKGALDGMRWLVQLFGPHRTATAPRLWLDATGRLDPPFDSLPRTMASIWPESFDANDLSTAIPLQPMHEVAAIPRLDALGVIDIVGLVASTPAQADRERAWTPKWSNGNLSRGRDLSTCIRIVEAAMPVLHRWPEAWHELIADVAGRNREADDGTIAGLFSTEMGRLVRMPYRDLKGQPIKVLSDEVTN